MSLARELGGVSVLFVRILNVGTMKKKSFVLFHFAFLHHLSLTEPSLLGLAGTRLWSNQALLVSILSVFIQPLTTLLSLHPKSTVLLQSLNCRALGEFSISSCLSLPFLFMSSHPIYFNIKGLVKCISPHSLKSPNDVIFFLEKI